MKWLRRWTRRDWSQRNQSYLQHFRTAMGREAKVWLATSGSLLRC